MSKPALNLDHRFTYHPPTPERGRAHAAVREAGLAFAEIVDTYCHDSREKALAITKIEEAVMWANAQIARGSSE